MFAFVPWYSTQPLDLIAINPLIDPKHGAFAQRGELIWRLPGNLRLLRLMSQKG